MSEVADNNTNYITTNMEAYARFVGRMGEERRYLRGRFDIPPLKEASIVYIGAQCEIYIHRRWLYDASLPKSRRSYAML